MTKPDAMLTRLRTYNPVPPKAGPPERAWSAAACLEEIENRSGTMPIEARFEPAPRETQEPKNLSRRWVVAAATGVVVLLAVVWAQQPGSDQTPVIIQPDPTPTTAPETTPTTVSTIPDPISSSGWSRVPHDETVFGGLEEQINMWSVTVGGPGLVAVGSDGPDAAVWTSPDGITWSQVPHDAAVFGGEMNSVTVGGPGLVAVA